MVWVVFINNECGLCVCLGVCLCLCVSLRGKDREKYPRTKEKSKSMKVQSYLDTVLTLRNYFYMQS